MMLGTAPFGPLVPAEKKENAKGRAVMIGRSRR
jgi:hypothetical protein